MIRMTGEQYRKFKGTKPPASASPSRKRHFQAARVDENQPDIVATLRKLGFAVECTHMVGNGFFDLTCSKGGLNIIVEVKNGLKPPSAREYTDKQRRFNFSWQGLRCVVTCAADCVRLAESVNAMLSRLKEVGITLEVKGNPEEQYKPSLY